MGTFNVTSSNLNNQYKYSNDTLIVIGNYNQDVTTTTLLNVNGSAYRKNAQGEQGDYIGNFSGTMRNGEILYSLSEMSRHDSNAVWDAIDEIEPYILGENE